MIVGSKVPPSLVVSLRPWTVRREGHHPLADEAHNLLMCGNRTSGKAGVKTMARRSLKCKGLGRRRCMGLGLERIDVWGAQLHPIPHNSSFILDHALTTLYLKDVQNILIRQLGLIIYFEEHNTNAILHIARHARRYQNTSRSHTDKCSTLNTWKTPTVPLRPCRTPSQVCNACSGTSTTHYLSWLRGCGGYDLRARLAQTVGQKFTRSKVMPWGLNFSACRKRNPLGNKRSFSSMFSMFSKIPLKFPH